MHSAAVDSKMIHARRDNEATDKGLTYRLSTDGMRSLVRRGEGQISYHQLEAAYRYSERLRRYPWWFAVRNCENSDGVMK